MIIQFIFVDFACDVDDQEKWNEMGGICCTNEGEESWLVTLHCVSCNDPKKLYS